MRLFHDEEDETPKEPVPGLPAALPEGERVVWQGQPNAASFALHVFHLRFILLYFVVATGFRLIGLSQEGAETAPLISATASSTFTCLAAMGLLYGLAVLMVRSTLYTLTTQRVVLRYGVAIRKYINLPFGQIRAADLKCHGRRTGDISLRLSGGRVSYLNLWPHARPFRMMQVEPALRAISEPRSVAALMAETIQASAPDGVRVQSSVLADPSDTGMAGAAGLAIGT